MAEPETMRGDYARTWDEWREGPVERVSAIPGGATRAMLKRVGTSHRGIAGLKQLEALEAAAVNQEFLDEICELERLRFLHLDYPVTAADLSGLSRLTELRTLMLTTVRTARDFAPILTLPKLEVLLIEQAKHISDLEFLRHAHRLKIVGVEGSIWTKQTIDSLRPIAGLRGLEELHMSSVRLLDTDLSPLAACPRLRLLRSARFAPKAEFERLRRLMPALECRWCDRYEVT